MNPWQNFEQFKKEYEAAEEWLESLREIGLEAGHLEDLSDYDGERYELTDPTRRAEIQLEEAQEARRRAEHEAKRRDEFMKIWKDARNQHGIN